MLVCLRVCIVMPASVSVASMFSPLELAQMRSLHQRKEELQAMAEAASIPQVL